MAGSGGAKLNRQRSCACPSAVLDVGSWRNGSRRRSRLGLSRRHAAAGEAYCDEDEDEELAPLGYSGPGRARAPRWKVLWRRIVMGKRRIFHSRVASVRVPYDPYTYVQNFEDQGSATWMEAENLTRSFSARFAPPF